MEFLLLQASLQGRQILVGHPMDAVDGTGVDRLLNAIGAVTVLSDRPGATPTGLHQKRVGRNVGAIATADADGFIDPDGLLAQGSTKQRLTPTAPGLTLGIGNRGKGQGWIHGR